jgi:tripartite-type tricarboxylate transporter receptor subunit TctC
MNNLGATLMTVVALAASPPAFAQSAWKPEKPVEFVVLSAPGAGNDRTARLMQKIWREAKWLENVNVLNKGRRRRRPRLHLRLPARR